MRRATSNPLRDKLDRQIPDPLMLRMSANSSIIIPTFNRAAQVGATLASLQALRTPVDANVELIVIDNNSTDNTARVVEDTAGLLPFDVRVVRETQQGLCHARNRGLKEARHEHIIFFDDDVRVAADWLCGYTDAVHTLGADCVVGPVHARLTGPTPSYVTPRVLQSITSSYSLHGEALHALPADHAHQVPGCNFGVRKDVAEEVGCFDVRFDRSGRQLLAGGDTEFGLRLVRAGRVVAYQPACSVEHILGPEKLSKAYLRRRWRGLGATQRMLSELHGRNGSLASSLRGRLGLLRLAATSVGLSLAGHQGAAFQRQLETVRAWGYWCSNPMALLKL